MSATDRQAFFDTMREIDRRVDELRGCIARAHREKVLGVMDRRYVLGSGTNPLILKVSVYHEADERPDPVVDVLAELVEAVTVEVNEKGAGGRLLARLSDARDCLKERMRRK